MEDSNSDTSTRGARSKYPKPEEVLLPLLESTNSEEDTLLSSSKELESKEEIKLL